MKNKEIYSLIILLVILSIIAIIIGIVKGTNTKKDVEASMLEDVALQEKEDVLTVYMEETNEEEVLDAEEQQEEVNQANEQEEQKNEVNTPYYIKINYNQNVVTIYAKDEQGNYTKPVKAMVCSCGTATPTSGVYTTTDKYKWGKLFGGVSGQYCTRIVKSILFHSVPYLTYGDKSSLEYWEYDKLGTTASAGCIRLTVEDAQWIYNNCVKGTQVEFYSDLNPGPLGKPTTQKISEDESVRGWDPTDPDANNPWKNYVKDSQETVVPQPQPEPEIPETTIPETPEEQEKPNEPTESDKEENEEKEEGKIDNTEDKEEIQDIPKHEEEAEGEEDLTNSSELLDTSESKELTI